MSKPLRIAALDLPGSRRIKGISLEDIALRTKISLRFLRAIEAEEFELLPGGIFNTSYLRQYAAAIGMDESELISYYRHQIEPSPIPAIPEPKGRTRAFFDRWLRMSASAHQQTTR